MAAFPAWIPRKIAVFEYPGHVVDVYDIVPEKLVSPIPLLICTGWLEVPESWRKHVERLASLGNRVIVYDAPHGLPIRTGPLGFLIERQKMQTAVAILKALRVEQVDVVGRSEGAIWAVLLADFYPTLVRHVILQNPAGVIGQDWPLPFYFRWRRDQKQLKNNEEHDPPPFAPVSIGTVFKRNWWRTIASVWAIMNSNVLPKLRQSKADGHKIAIVTTQHDRLFPWEKIQARTGGLFDWCCVLRGGHTSFFCRPEEFADAIVLARDCLEENSR